MARRPQKISEVVPKAIKDLALRDKITFAGSQKITGICVTEMSQLFHCLKKYSFNEEGCTNEIQQFQKCYNKQMTALRQPEKSADKRRDDINRLLQKYSTRRKN